MNYYFVCNVHLLHLIIERIICCMIEIIIGWQTKQNHYISNYVVSAHFIRSHSNYLFIENILRNYMRWHQLRICVILIIIDYKSRGFFILFETESMKNEAIFMICIITSDLHIIKWKIMSFCIAKWSKSSETWTMEYESSPLYKTYRDIYRYVCFINNLKFKAPRIHTINIDYKSIFRGSYQFNSKWHWNLFVRGFFLTIAGLVLIIIINNRHGKNQLHFILNYLYVSHSMWSVFLINMWALRKVPSNRMCRACSVWKQSLRNDTLHMAHLSHFVLMKAMNIFQLVWLKLCGQSRLTKRYGWWKIIANKLLTIIWAIQTSFQQVVQFLNQLNRMKSDT